MSTSTELRRIVGAMTERPWFARSRFLSRVRDSSGVGGTLPTNHIGNLAERDDAVAIAALANHADALVALVEAVEGYARVVDPEGFSTRLEAELHGALEDALAAVHAIKETP